MILKHKIKPEFHGIFKRSQFSHRGGLSKIMEELNIEADSDLNDVSVRVALAKYVAAKVLNPGFTEAEKNVVAYDLLMPANRVIEFCKINNCHEDFHPAIAAYFRVTKGCLTDWLYILGVTRLRRDIRETAQAQ